MNTICSAGDTFVCVRTVCSDNQCKLLVTTVDEWIHYKSSQIYFRVGFPVKNTRQRNGVFHEYNSMQ